MIFQPCWRWFGPKDPVSLDTVRQAGATGVVTALHHLPPGEEWSVSEIKACQKMIEDVGLPNRTHLSWAVVESLPVSEAIKQGLPDRDRHLERYRQSLRNLGKCGITIVCYNFMPVLDWLRTDLAFKLPDGSRALRYDPVDVAVFDHFLLKRPDADVFYGADERARAEARYEAMDAAARQRLEQTILLALPGTDESFTIAQLQTALTAYKEIDAARLRAHLIYFLQAVTPAAEEAGIKLAIHPDDPPWPVFGLPRIAGTKEDLTAIFSAVDSPANGLTFCAGSLGARPENDLPGMVQEFDERIHFVHLRSVKHESDGSFFEANHLEGEVDMVHLIQLFGERTRRGAPTLPMRPDHGHLMLDDLGKTFYPGYSAIGRLRGLAELRGVELGVLREKSRQGGNIKT